MKECLRGPTVDWGPIPIDLIKSILENAYDARSTQDNIFIVERITGIVKHSLHQDLFHQYYSIGDSISEQLPDFHYHKGLGETDEGEEGRKETIEEVFRSWHEENEREAGVHLEYRT